MTDDRDYTSQEYMTGWDDPNALDTPPTNVTLGAGSRLLMAISQFMKNHTAETRNELLDAVADIDWTAMDFTQSALDRGEDIFSCHDTNDVLIKYQR